MNEELQQAIAMLIEKSLSGINEGINFLSAELPDFVNQLLVWYALSTFIYMVVGITILICMIKYVQYVYKNWNKFPEEARIFNGLAGGSGVFFVSLLTLGELINITWLKILVAPKVWLVEYAATLSGVK